MDYSVDIEAEVVFLKPNEGGRNKLVFQGFRPTFIYDNRLWDADLHFEGDDFLPDGLSRVIFFKFVSPRSHIGKLFPGKSFELWDGRVIAKGKVLKIVDLEQSAKNSACQVPIIYTNDK